VNRNNNTCILRVQDLTVSFGPSHKPVVSGLHFELHRGETLGLVGESGSGKTLTGLALLRLLPPGAHVVRGSILLYPGTPEEKSITRLNEEEMTAIRGRHISMVFQEPMTSLNPSMRCGHQVAEALAIHSSLTPRQIREEVLHWFEEMHLPGPGRIYHAYPHELSGGQRQRVMMAMALCTRPAVLIADEPTTALDVTIQQSIIRLLKNLQEKYRPGILFITHDLGLISEIAGRLAVMQEGMLAEQGPLADVLKEPKHPYTKGLLHCRPVYTRQPVRLPTVREFLEKGKVEPEERREEDQISKRQQIYSSPPMLVIKDLKTWFTRRKGWKKETVRAVNRVSFEVYRGETLGLVGESGCGKTTLGRSLLNLVHAQSGQILYSGVNTLEIKGKALKAFRRKFQIVFQDPYSSLNPRITVGETIMEPMRVHGLSGNRISRQRKMYRLLEKVRLDPSHAGRFPHEFSGGQRQRIGIARALALEPEFIIFDESVSSLDVSVQAEILNLMNQLKEEFGLTYIFISHDLSVVKYMSDRVLVMKNGKLVESGEAEELFRNPKEQYTRELIRSVPGQSMPVQLF